MAFAAAATNKPSLRCTTARHQQGPNTTVGRVSRARLSCVASAAAASPDMAVPSSKYAILRLGGVRQMLQEGLLYTCPKHCLLQEQQQHFSTSTAAGNGAMHAAPAHLQDSHAHASTAAGDQRSFVLSRVLGLHNGQQFTWGTPYVPNTLVEVEVVEEFEGPKPLTSAAAGIAPSVDESTMTIYRVNAIRAAQ